MPDSGARRRALRTVLSALASGGLTAAALGGPLASGAGAASVGSVPVVPEGTVGGGGAESGAETPPTTTTTPAPTTTVPTTTTTVPQATPQVQEAPAVVLQRRQKATRGQKANPSLNATKGKEKKATANNNVAGSPQSVQAGALAAVLASSQASAQALAFYRVPLFLLPIYKAAAVQYGVPWQILAAINEIETDYGNDQSVSSAGAVGWMQFMPSTWLQYGVDALNAGYADPYNPVDAIFAAARYLRAAGASKDVRTAIFSYNHSEEYVNSVMLRAKLISTYPTPVIATLTGLIDGKLPVTGKQLQWGTLTPEAPSASSATAGASAVTAASPAAAAAAGTPGTAQPTPGTAQPTPGSKAAPSPTAAAAHAPKAPPLRTVELTSSAHATVVAVQDGRIMQIGDSRKIGKFVVLRDVYGDVFTYAGLGSIAPTYTVAKPTGAQTLAPGVKAAGKHDPAPSQPASAGTQAPLTLLVKTPALQKQGSLGGTTSIPTSADESVPAGMRRARLFARPGNPDARAALAVQAARKARRDSAGQKLALRKGAVVSSGTVLGTVSVPHGAKAGHLRFAIRPAGDANYVDPGPILANWGQLQKALHPAGAKATNALLGATAGDVFLLSRPQLERAVLSDPAITIYACGRQDIASGAVDRRVLALLAFLSRSGLAPTVSALRCGQSQVASSGGPSAAFRGDSVAITAINGVPLARHQGPGTITDLTIRALLTVPAEFVPQKIVSLMRYPGQSNTHSDAANWNHMNLELAPVAATSTLKAAATGSAAHSAGKGTTAPVPIVTTSPLTAEQWSQLITRVGTIPAPKVATKQTSAAVPDPKHG
jgi:Transglycosylase SLT domain